MATSTENGHLARLADTLWYERRLLEYLLFKLVSANLVLIADDRRFVGPAVAEVDAVMEQIRTWGQEQLSGDGVEANSGLGQAIGYFERHFVGLTAFCRLEGAPLDNNPIERALKLIIRGRKNALFFKTPAGAAIADVITSIIATAHQAGVNVFDYLVVLQRHAEAVKRQPEQWLPWTYQQTLSAEKKAA